MEDIDNIPKKRGRPVGSKGKGAKFTNYNPKRWHPEFDLIILESIAGKSNEEIGRKFGYTKEHISNILSTEETKQVKAKVRNVIDKEFEGGIKQRLASIGEKAIKHIESFIEDETNQAINNPFQFIDRVVKIAQVTGTVNDETKKSSGNMLINTGTIVLSGDKVNNLLSAIDKSKEVDDVEFEVISG